MSVIIKDFQVITDQPDNQTMAAAPPSKPEPSSQRMPPSPKKLAQTLRHIRERLARIHAD